MQNKNINNTDSADKNDEMAALEAEVRDALAHGTHIQETVHRLTLKAMNARNLDVDSLQRIITAVIQGVQDGAQQTLQHASDQTHTAKSQITEAIAGLDSALAGFAEASKLAVEEAAGRAKKFSDQELTRTRTDLESLESLFLDTLNNTASATKGLVSDIFHDLAGHAQRNGTAVGRQLKETIAIFAQQMKSVGHTQLEMGVHLAHSTADFIHKLADGVLSGIKDRKKSDDQ
ncbi:MAG: DUF6781 family protein [Pseudomonadota bacterium]